MFNVSPPPLWLTWQAPTRALIHNVNKAFFGTLHLQCLSLVHYTTHSANTLNSFKNLRKRQWIRLNIFFFEWRVTKLDNTRIFISNEMVKETHLQIFFCFDSSVGQAEHCEFDPYKYRYRYESYKWVSTIISAENGKRKCLNGIKCCYC